MDKVLRFLYVSIMSISGLTKPPASQDSAISKTRHSEDTGKTYPKKKMWKVLQSST